jgi:hypothetical protein
VSSPGDSESTAPVTGRIDPQACGDAEGREGESDHDIGTGRDVESDGAFLGTAFATEPEELGRTTGLRVELDFHPERLIGGIIAGRPGEVGIRTRDVRNESGGLGGVDTDIMGGFPCAAVFGPGEVEEGKLGAHGGNEQGEEEDGSEEEHEARSTTTVSRGCVWKRKHRQPGGLSVRVEDDRRHRRMEGRRSPDSTWEARAETASAKGPDGRSPTACSGSEAPFRLHAFPATKRRRSRLAGREDGDGDQPLAALAGLAEDRMDDDWNTRMDMFQQGYNLLNGLFGGMGGSR